MSYDVTLTLHTKNIFEIFYALLFFLVRSSRFSFLDSLPSSCVGTESIKLWAGERERRFFSLAYSSIFRDTQSCLKLWTETLTENRNEFSRKHQKLAATRRTKSVEREGNKTQNVAHVFSKHCFNIRLNSCRKIGNFYSCQNWFC